MGTLTDTYKPRGAGGAVVDTERRLSELVRRRAEVRGASAHAVAEATGLQEAVVAAHLEGKKPMSFMEAVTILAGMGEKLNMYASAAD